MTNLQLLQEVTAFVWAEGDMLDHADYQRWLDLWTEDGRYVIPIDPLEENFEDTLNYAYDDHHLREKRVHRLLGDESISTSPRPRTVRSISRFRLLEVHGDRITVRCAQNLREFRKEVLQHYTADIVYQLVRSEGELKLERKVIRLINSTDALSGIGYIL